MLRDMMKGMQRFTALLKTTEDKGAGRRTSQTY